MSTYAIFYFDGNYNSSVIVEDPANQLENFEDWGKIFPEIFTCVEGFDPEIVGIVETYIPTYEDGTKGPKMSLGNQDGCNTFFTLTPKLLSP